LLDIDRYQVDPGLRKEAIEFVDRLQAIVSPSAGEHGSCFQIGRDRHYALGIGREARSESKRWRLAEHHRDYRRRVDDDHFSSPDAASHSAFVTGRVS
jgi:hypothetical protein